MCYFTEAVYKTVCWKDVWGFCTTVYLYGFMWSGFVAACTNDFGMPVAWNKCLENFCRHASECTHISSNVSFKRTRVSLASFLTRNMWFEICSKVDILLILKELRHKKNWSLDLLWHCLLGPSEVSTISKPSVEIKCQLDATDDFYCRSYCLLNMFRAPLCPSSGAREYCTSGRCLSYLVLGFQVVGMVWSWGLWNRTHNPQLHTIPTTWKPSTKYDRQQPLV